MSDMKLNAMEIDAIGEILNISLGASATAVSTMLDTRVDITTPEVRIRTKEEFEFRALEPAVCVEISFIEGITGKNVMILKKDDVRIIVEKLMRTEIPAESFELSELYISAICEVMNQMMGASATALSELLSKTVNISTPVSFEVENVNEFKTKYFEDERPMVDVSFDLKIADEMSSEFMNLISIGLAKDLVSGFFPDGTPEVPEPPEPIEKVESSETTPVESESGGTSGGVLSQEEIEALMAGQLNDTAQPEPEPTPAEPAVDEPSGGVLSQEEIEALMAGQLSDTAQPEPAAPKVEPVAENSAVQEPTAAAPEAQPAMSAQSEQMMNQMMQMMQKQMELQAQQMNSLQQRIDNAPQEIKVNPVPKPNLKKGDGEGNPDANMDLIMGVGLDISVEIGRTKKLVSDILELSKGSLVVLDKLAGEQVDVYVNGMCIAKGDVVVVDDNFGVRITEILQEEIEVIQS